MTDLPYNAEYAKSGRASCKGCKENIPKDSLRVGIMVQSPHFDGKVPMWHHVKCFLVKKNSGKIEDVANFDNLRFEDQQILRDGMAAGGSGGKTTKKGPKSDFSIEYAKSSRAACKLCGEKIQKTEIRISKLLTDTPEAHRFGPLPGWHHVDCFVKCRLDLDFTSAADKLPGFQTLIEDDRKMLLDKIPQLGVKRKAEEKPVKENKKQASENKILKAQSDLLFSMRDKIANNLTKKEITQILEYNDQHVSSAEQHLRDHLADCMVFGALERCPECKSASPRYSIDAYRCPGNITEWTKCVYVTKAPRRRAFVIPDELRDKHDFLRVYAYKKRDRYFVDKDGSVCSSKEQLPLHGCIIHVFGKFNSPKKIIENKVSDLGGCVATKLTSFVLCCISTENDVAKNGEKVQNARALNVHIVSPKFLEDVDNGKNVVAAIKDNALCDWGGDPSPKINAKEELKAKKAAKSMTDVSKSSTIKVSVKGGVAVDPDSGLADCCQVYQSGKDIYNSVLGMVDLGKGMNSYYKHQVLVRNSGRKYYLFRSWGRVGTSIGGNKLQEFTDPLDAIAEFERLYFEKTANRWHNRHNFKKKPGSLYPLDIDYGESLDDIKQLKPGDNSKLPKPVQELICLIFDVELMKKAMVEFEIDLKKMPLGKLSRKQIEKAYSVLTEVQQVLSSDSNHVKILDASNRFYTLIPHDFGMNKPPLLDNEELIKTKIEMLDSLLEIEVAYKLLQGEGGQSTRDPVDEHYEKLKTDIEILDKALDEFEIINTYLQNTHAATHNQYKLKLRQVFKINRQGENERYQNFKSLHNKKLLWHGSRLTNFVGILSQGLRIAPPEAPSTGYMFGKGIYFADMVSKSANYCFATKKNPTALLLLCEVALGNMYERTNAEFVTKLPKDKHSTKGLGMTVPDPNEKTFIGEVEVPYGKPAKASVPTSSLLYNEYIVYDINQVNIKYLLEVDFIHR